MKVYKNHEKKFAENNRTLGKNLIKMGKKCEKLIYFCVFHFENFARSIMKKSGKLYKKTVKNFGKFDKNGIAG